jgi:hypothetical protein
MIPDLSGTWVDNVRSGWSREWGRVSLADMDPAPLSPCEASRTSRRRFLGGTAGAAAALVLGESMLTACGSEGNSSLAATALQYRTASEVTEGIVNGELSGRHVAEETLGRIGDVNPRLNAVVALAKDEMLEAADKVDRGDAKGPLAGVPVTIKEAINVAGLHTTWAIRNGKTTSRPPTPQSFPVCVPLGH